MSFVEKALIIISGRGPTIIVSSNVSPQFSNRG
jgi:hypothetical protein